MSTSELCKNKVANQSELFEIIKFYYGEYKAESDVLKSTQMIHELMIFILFNLDIEAHRAFLDALYQKAVTLKIESAHIKSLSPKLYADMNHTLNEIIAKIQQ